MTLFARAHAALLLKEASLPSKPVLPLRWKEHWGGDHLFEDAAGRLFAVDLVLREAKVVTFQPVQPTTRTLHP